MPASTRPRRAGAAAPAAALLATLLAGCAAPPVAAPPPLAQLAPAAWGAPLPHGGSAARLADWWRAAGDDVLGALLTKVSAPRR